MLTISSPEDLIPGDHPIRRIRVLVGAVYARSRRPCVPPDQLLKATVLVDVLDAPVVVTTSDLAESLEFDVVVVVDPATLVADTGLRSVYVSARRITSRLLLVHRPGWELRPA